jgi:hypothetical protein
MTNPGEKDERPFGNIDRKEQLKICRTYRITIDENETAVCLQ